MEHLTKVYGTTVAVSDLSVTLDSGGIYGFLGPNGAGKSTTMNIMTGCLSATEGHVRIDGCDIFEQPNQAKRLIGYLPEQPPLYMSETPLEYLRFVGEAKGLRGGELERQIEQVVAQTGIEGVCRRRISTLSKGYKQRVGIAQALLGSPRVIVLDEPTVGLDPLQIIEIRALIKELGRDHTVIFSSHILSEVQNLCDRILIISKGKLVAFDRTEDLEKHLLSSNQIILTTDGEEGAVRALLDGLAHISRADFTRREDGLLSVCLNLDCDDMYSVSRPLFFAFADKGMPLLELSLKKASLEEVFLELTEGEQPGGAAEETPEEKEADEP